LYTSWNALAASAYWAAWSALGDNRLDERAHATIRTIASRMWDREAKSLYHFDRGEGRQLPDLLGDVAANLSASLDAYETGLHPEALGGARRMALVIRDRLEDAAAGGFYDRPASTEPGRLASREKAIDENALAADALLRLAAISGDERWRESAVRALRGFVSEYRRWGQFASAYANAVARAQSESLLISVVGPADDPTANALWRAARASTHPARVLSRLEPGRDADRIGALAFPIDRVAAYVCIGTVCSAPLTDEASLDRALAEASDKVLRPV
jgi:uncharacterized protein YyaL (SSP411 family)